MATVQSGVSSSVSGKLRQSGPWILGCWPDQLLFVLSPVLIVPLVAVLQFDWLGVDTETIALFAGTLGGLGHHLPGMIRAYCDRDLFQRFRLRFIIAPIFLLAVCIPMAQHHLSAMLVTLIAWGYWHSLMQVYGFVRIYDVKTGSVSATTAQWDWLMCVTWFGAGMVFSSGKISRLLDGWYDSGGPMISPVLIETIRWSVLTLALAVLMGFLINHVIQSRTANPPNPVKLLMLASGIGFWWFTMVYVSNIILGLALFEVFHDVQYLAIVWIYNAKRCESSADIGAFMKFLFRNSFGMVCLYVGMVIGYGLISIGSLKSSNEWLRTSLVGFVWASTILHFYYDGFIWKVRERGVRAGLGLDAAKEKDRPSSRAGSAMLHAMKWTPFVILTGWLGYLEISGSTLSEQGGSGRRWPEGVDVSRLRNIVQAVPGDLRSRRQLITSLLSRGEVSEAVRLLNEGLRENPSWVDGYLMLGEACFRGGQLDQAAEQYRSVLLVDAPDKRKSLAHYGLGQVYLQQKNPDLARQEFQNSLRLNSAFQPAVDELAILNKASSGPGD